MAVPGPHPRGNNIYIISSLLHGNTADFIPITMQLRRCSCHAHYSAVTVVSRGVPTIPITVQLSKPQQLPSSANLVSCRNPVTQICATVHQVFSSHTPHDLSTADSNQPPPLPSKHLLPHTHTLIMSVLFTHNHLCQLVISIISPITINTPSGLWPDTIHWIDTLLCWRGRMMLYALYVRRNRKPVYTSFDVVLQWLLNEIFGTTTFRPMWAETGTLFMKTSNRFLYNLLVNMELCIGPIGGHCAER